jgi:2-polyprenyl-3-methyl-5-hydroxy-6-metoxy-1,4-benzoquinol methylase
MNSLQDRFGNIDIYVFDQLLRGRIAPGMRIFDAGCGGGRNIGYLLREGYDVSVNDRDPQAVARTLALAESVAPNVSHDFRVEAIEDTSFEAGSFDVVIASAVLHFARDDAHFSSMVRQLWRVLKPGGMFFARLASTISLEGDMQPIGEHRYRLPDGSDRYLVDARTLERVTEELGGEWLDPIKTTVVHEQRSMTTWVVRKAMPGTI